VSHDLRTVLTRFKLELALIEATPETEAMKKDVDEMAHMLEAYLAFARGDLGEQSAPTDMAAFLDELKDDAERHGHKTTVVFHGTPIVTVRPAAFKRCLANLVSNAARYASSISTTMARAFRLNYAKRCSSRSCGSTTPAIRTRAARVWVWPLRATSRVRMAAISCSATAR
jgi:two-component system osmolarity sensor histidine kinase EnvZ